MLSIPRSGDLMRKKPVLSYELFFEDGGEGGIDSLRSPCGQSPRRLVVCPTGCAATQPIPGPRPFGARASSVQKRSRRFCVEPRSGVLIPPVGWLYVKKKPVLSYELFLEDGGEGGIRTPDTLPYTHFPGVLLQPLGHLTKLSLQHDWNGR